MCPFVMCRLSQQSPGCWKMGGLWGLGMGTDFGAVLCHESLHRRGSGPTGWGHPSRTDAGD